MGFTKISDSAMQTHGVIGMDDTPNLSVIEMQRKFDELATDVLRPAFDNLIDELEAPTAAASIGTPSGTVQTDLTELKSKEHFHTNKDTIDKFSVDENNKLLYDGKSISTSSESFKTVTVNGTPIVATTEDTLKFVEGDNVKLQADVVSKTIKINSTAGDKGEKGDPGASVDVEVLPKEGKNRTVNFVNNDTRELLNSIIVRDGDNGIDGQNGRNGASITAVSEPIENGVKVTILDRDTEEEIDSFTLQNGESGTVVVSYKEEWSDSIIYNPGDVVHRINASYLAVSRNSGHDPQFDYGHYYWGLMCVDGQKGEQGNKGDKGDTGTSADPITATSDKISTDTTRVTITNATTGAVLTEFDIKDGKDGSGSGDMSKSVYDTDNDGSVDSADTLKGLSASVIELNYVAGATDNIQSQLNAKANDSELKAVAKSGSYNDLSEKPSIPTTLAQLPTDADHRTVSDAEKTAWNNKLDSYTETDPTVPSWAKEPNKPSYTASEVGAYTKAEVDAMIGDVETLLASL